MNDQQRAAMRCALEALEEAHTVIEHRQDVRKREEAITALREALAQPQGEWVDLTDDELLPIWNKARAVIAAFKAKNTPVQREQQEPVAWALKHKNGLEFNSGYGMVKTLQQAEDMQRRNLGALKVVPLYTPTPSVEAAIATMRDALVHIREYWNRDQNETAMADALWHIIEVAEKSLTGDKK